MSLCDADADVDVDPNANTNTFRNGVATIVMKASILICLDFYLYFSCHSHFVDNKTTVAGAHSPHPE